MAPSRVLRSSSARNAPYHREYSSNSSSSRQSSVSTDISDDLLFYSATPPTSISDVGSSRSTRTGPSPPKGNSSSRPSVIVVNGVELKPTVVFDTFFYWLAERKAIDDRRRAGQPAPWTKDKILQEYSFCNSFRVLDRICQYMIKNVIETGPQDYVEVVFRVVLFNMFTKIETWELLQEKLGPLTWATYVRDKYLAVLDEAKARGMALYTGAFQKSGTGWRSGSHTHVKHIYLLENLMDNEFPYKLTKAKYLADVFEYLICFPAMGNFNAYQLMLNLSYTKVLNFHPNDFVIAGPGAVSGLTKMFGRSFTFHYKQDTTIAEDIIRWLVEHQDEHFERLGFEFSRLGPRKLPLDVADIEHAVCETDKYCRRAHPSIKGSNNSTQIKTRYKYHTDPYPAQPILPKAWSNPKRKKPRIRAGPIVVDHRYEVDDIRDHKVDEEGNKLYFTRWVGYSYGTWEFESSLLLDAPGAVSDYVAKLKGRSR